MPAPVTVPSCPHERGHGTSVCLRCRADEHARSSAKFHRSLAKGGVVAVCVALIAVAGAGVLSSRRSTTLPRTAPPTIAAQVTHSNSARTPVISVGASAAPAVVHSEGLRDASASAIVAVAGRTELADSMFVLRAGDSAEVVFDTQGSRTRRRDKFENVVRQTLPAVLGAVGDSLLASIPSGELATGGDLLTELPSRGIRMPASDGRVVIVRPGTRAGRDGPLVVSYRVTVQATP